MIMPDAVNRTAAMVIHHASLAGNCFLKTEAAAYKNAAKPNTNVAMDNDNELFIFHLKTVLHKMSMNGLLFFPSF